MICTKTWPADFEFFFLQGPGQDSRDREVGRSPQYISEKPPYITTLFKEKVILSQVLITQLIKNELCECPHFKDPVTQVLKVIVAVSDDDGSRGWWQSLR
jgi:hypothetical protein